MEYIDLKNDSFFDNSMQLEYDQSIVDDKLIAESLNLTLESIGVNDSKVYNAIHLDDESALKLDTITNKSDFQKLSNIFEVEENEIDSSDEYVQEETDAGISSEDEVKKKNFQNKIRTVKAYECPYCEKLFSRSDTLKEHIRIHTNERPYECEICEKRFIRKYHLEVHIRTHTQEKAYLCTDCGAGFICSNSLKLHVTNHHTKDFKFTCERCGKGFLRRFQYEQHMQSHLGIKNFKCDVCNRSYGSAGYLKDHLRLHTGERPHICDICGKKFNLTSQLNKHYRTHTGEKPYSCPHCNYTCSASDAMYVHIKIHLNQRNYKCDVCDASFNQPAGLQYHKQIHTGIKKHVCNICGKGFYTKHAKSRHVLTHNPKNKYNCPICETWFPTNAILKTHYNKSLCTSKLVDSEQACVICKKVLKSHNKIVSHFQMHHSRRFALPLNTDDSESTSNINISTLPPEKIQILTCTTCQLIFADTFTLKQHRKKVCDRKNKTTECHLCHKVYKVPATLALHLKYHSGDLFKCKICYKQFAQRNDFYRHLVTHTGEQPYGCTICEKRYSERNTLLRHLRDMHPDVNVAVKFDLEAFVRSHGLLD